MKKLILGLTALLVFSACSTDDGGSTPGFESHIQVDGQTFTPSANSAMLDNVVTTFTEGVNNGEARVRTFHMIKSTANVATMEAIQVSVIYPVTQASVTGTYEFNYDTIDPNLMAQGMYMIGTSGYTFGAGSMTVTDLGDNKFKLEFDSVIATNIMNQEQRTVTGYIEGTFAVEQE